ncbi:MAG: LiaI-LiaF-like domain-containing protein [Chitinophagales bacterium]
MDNTDDKDVQNNQPYRAHGGRFWIPLGIILIGGFLLARQMGVLMPEWIFSWPTIMIVLGIFSGLAHGFRGGGWLVLILIGTFFLLDEMIPGVSFHQYLWPVGLIAVGLFMLLRPRRSHWGGGDWGGCNNRNRFRQERRRLRQHMRQNWRHPDNTDSGHTGFGSASKSFSSEDYIDVTTVFGGIHKNIVSKDFKGGDITVFMGGAEINLSQADIQGIARLDVTQIMGGTKLIVPPHWEIRSQLTSIFGNVEDKRQQHATVNPEKVLILDGSSVFGGIEIRNY